MICPACEQWIVPALDRSAGSARCPECGSSWPHRFLPLFIVTGASGTGKTAVVSRLRSLLPEWDVFETDVLWDSGGDWTMIKHNWLRIAYHLVSGGRPVILCGSMVPEELAGCDTLRYFSAVHWLALHCDDAARERRLRARPAWRGCAEEFIREHERYAAWFLENAATAFDPPLTVMDTTQVDPEETARRIAEWAGVRWEGHA